MILFRTQICPLFFCLFRNLSCIRSVHDLKRSFAILTVIVLHVVTVRSICSLDLSFTSISLLFQVIFPFSHHDVLISTYHYSCTTAPHRIQWKVETDPYIGFAREHVDE